MRQCAKVYFQSNGDTEWAEKKYSKELKAQIALDAIKGQKTIAELASEYGVHANQISIWKKQLLDAAPTLFYGRIIYHYLIFCKYHIFYD